MTVQDPSQTELLDEIARLKRRVAELEARTSSAQTDAYLTLLQETVFTLMNRQELDDLLGAIIHRATDLAHTEHGFLYLLDPNEQIMRLRAACGLFETSVIKTLTRDQGVTGYVWTHGEKQIVHDYFNWPHHLADSARFHSIAALPLKSGEKVVGVIAIAYYEPERVFSDDVIESLTGFANIASLALDNASLYNTLKESQRFLENVADLSPDIIYVNDVADGQNVYVNYAIYRILGHPPEVFRGWNRKQFKEALHPDDVPQVQAAAKTLIADGGPVEYEYRMRHANGEYRWLRSRDTAFARNPDGSLRSILGVARDITEHKQDQDRLETVALQLERQNRMLDEILTATPDHFTLHDSDGRHLYASPLVLQSMGLKIEDVVGKTWRELNIDSPLGPQFDQNFQEVLRTRQTHRQDFHLTTDYGPRDIEIVLSPLFDDQGGIVSVLNTTHDITARKQAEDQLRYLARLVEMIPDAIISTDLEFHILSWNKGAEQMYGWREDEVLGKHVDHVIRTRHAGVSVNDLRRAFLEAEEWQGEVIHTRRDGVEIDVMSSTSAVRDSAGNMVGAVAVNRDVTARKRAEQRLRESEERFRALTEHSNDIVIILDADFNVTYISASVERILGYPQDIVIGRNALKLVHEDDAPALEVVLTHALASPGVLIPPVEYRRVHQDGSWRILEALTTNLLENPAVGGIVLNIRDVTDRKQVEDALRQSEVRFRTLMETLDAIVFIFGANELLYANPATERLLGYTEQELLDQGFWKAIHPDSILSPEQRATAYRQDNTFPAHREIKVITKSGDICWLDMRMAQAEFNGQQVLLGTALDITERKSAEERRLALNLEKERVRVLMEFVQHASHDFRTPLSTINTSVYLLERTEDPQRRQQRLDGIKDQVMHLERLVSGLLTMSRLDAGVAMKVRPENINQIILKVIGVSKTPANKKNLTIIPHLDESLPSAQVDILQIHHALENILENAIHHTPEAGTITLRSALQDDEIVIDVEDTGIGIGPDDLPRIFERFYRADKARSGGGPGLGLPIALKIIEGHGGRITVQSALGRGSLFRIYLPLNPANGGSAS